MNLNTVELHVDTHAGTGPHLLLVHGMLSSRAQWVPNVEALARVARPVVVELWGHGRSPAPTDPAYYHPDAYVDAFEHVRARLGIERWIVCGQSFGAALTLRYALEFPERVPAQVFTNSTSALADEAWAEDIRNTAPQLARAIAEHGRDALERMPIHPKHATRLPGPAHEALLADAAILDPEGVARTFQYTTPESPVRERVRENRVPALLVCGRYESRFAAHRTYAAEHMPHLEVVDLDAGHAVNIEAAAAFNTAVSEFISAHA